MRVMVIIGLAVLAFYIGKWTSDNWIAIGFFIGSVIAVALIWEDDVPAFHNIRLDEEERMIDAYSTRQTGDSRLFNTVLCVLGISWLLGRGDDEDKS